jgi:hypothetical protein
MSLQVRGLVEAGGVFLHPLVTIGHLRVHHRLRHHPPRPVLGLHAKRGRERDLERQRQEQKVEHVADHEHLHGTHLGLAPACEEILGELDRAREQ